MQEKSKESAQKKIVEVFSNVKNIQEWKYEFHKFLRSNMSWKSKPFFIENILRLPKWADFYTFSLAVQEITRVEKSWIDSEWFKDLHEELKPRPKIKQCVRCGLKVFPIASPRTGKEILLEVKPIEKNQENADIFVFTSNKEMKKVKELGENQGYIVHAPRCPQADYFKEDKKIS